MPLVLLCTTRAEKVFVLHFIPSPLISLHGVLCAECEVRGLVKLRCSEDKRKRNDTG